MIGLIFNKFPCMKPEIKIKFFYFIIILIRKWKSQARTLKFSYSVSESWCHNKGLIKKLSGTNFSFKPKFDLFIISINSWGLIKRAEIILRDTWLPIHECPHALQSIRLWVKSINCHYPNIFCIFLNIVCKWFLLWPWLEC